MVDYQYVMFLRTYIFRNVYGRITSWTVYAQNIYTKRNYYLKKKPFHAHIFQKRDIPTNTCIHITKFRQRAHFARIFLGIGPKAAWVPARPNGTDDRACAFA